MYEISTTSSKTALLIGGSGFIGTVLAHRLTQSGYNAIIPCRKPELSGLRVLPDVKMVRADIHDYNVLQQLCGQLTARDVVINLLGILQGSEGHPYGDAFRQAHADMPRKLIAAMNQCDVKRLLHVSALGAHTHGASMYQRSKGDGEQLVVNSGLKWTVFRPSVVFGQHDRFINMFSTMQKWLPIIPLAGAQVHFQPVFVGDVADSLVRSIALEATIGQCYNLAGPDVFTLQQLVQFAGQLSARKRLIIPLPSPLAWLQAWMMEHLPGPTLLSRDNLRSMTVDNVLPPGANNCLSHVFGITPTGLSPAIWQN